MTEQNEDNQLDETETTADAAVRMLLSGVACEAMIKAMDSQYMIFAPTIVKQGEQQASRWLQLNLVLFEFTIGLPMKLWNYWCMHWGSVPVLIVIPAGVISFLAGFLRAMWCSVITRKLVFKPKAVIFKQLRGE